MTDPRPIAESLEAARAAAARSQAARPTDPVPAEGREAFAAMVREGRERIAANREKAWAESCPPRFAAARLEDLGEPRRSEISAWCDEPEGRNLVLSGPVGCGKTHAAMAALRQVLPACLSWQIASVVELLERLRPGGPEGELERFASCSVLLLDDLGAERPTDWTAERLASIIDRRWNEERPIIATTNLTLGPDGELIEALGERSYSRLVGSGAVVLNLTGSDRRRQR